MPGSPLDPRARGTNDLIRQGAILCEGADDVLRGLEKPLIAREDERSRYSGRADLRDEEVDRVRERVAALLSPTPTPRDEIARLSGAPAPVVFAALVELSLGGRAALLPGGMVSSG